MIQERLPDSRAAHLLPIVDFLRERGNIPSPRLSYASYTENGFNFDRDGQGVFLFDQPLDLEAVKAHFELPATMGYTRNGIYDERNRLSIEQTVPQKALPTFE